MTFRAPIQLLLAAAFVGTLAGCGQAPNPTGQGLAASSAQASSLFRRAPKDRELTQEERRYDFDGFRKLATEAAVKWDKDARLLVGGSNQLDEKAVRTITSGYTFIFHTGTLSRLHVSVRGNGIRFAKCRFPRPLSLYPVLPIFKQKVAGDAVTAAAAIAAAKQAGKLTTKTFSAWIVQPRGYSDPVYYVTGNKLFGMGKTVLVNAATGAIVDTRVLPVGSLSELDEAVRAIDQLELQPLDAPGGVSI